jgi:hypothetical protein
MDACGGVIQNLEQRRFCCKTAGACSTKGHRAKVSIFTNALYMKHTRMGHALLDLSLPVSLLPDDMTVAGVMGQEHLLEVWVGYFNSLRAARARVSSSGTSSPWEEVETPTLEVFMKASTSFKMPKKLKLGNALGPDMIPVMSQSRGTSLSHIEDQGIDDDKVWERTKIERALQIVMVDWNELKTNFQLIYTKSELTGRS